MPRTDARRSLPKETAEFLGAASAPPTTDYPNGRSPGPFAAPPGQQLTVIGNAIEQSLERKISAAASAHRETSHPPAIEPQEQGLREISEALLSDRVVRLLLRKMDGLAQEERFRLGRLR